jgi:hypothetical protein
MPSRWYERRDYVWLLTAEPPVCRGGDSRTVLMRCERLRRGEACICRFNVAELSDDLAAIGADDLAEKWLSDRLEASDVEAFRNELALAHQNAVRVAQIAPKEERLDAEHGAERVGQLVNRLSTLVSEGAELTDEFSDELLE